MGYILMFIFSFTMVSTPFISLFLFIKGVLDYRRGEQNRGMKYLKAATIVFMIGLIWLIFILRN